MLFIRKRLLGAKLKINLKRHYKKTLEKPVVFHILLSFLTEEDILELAYVCQAFKKLIHGSIDTDNRLLKISLTKLRKCLRKTDARDYELLDEDIDSKCKLYHNPHCDNIELVYFKVKQSMKLRKSISDKFRKLNELNLILKNGDQKDNKLGKSLIHKDSLSKEEQRLIQALEDIESNIKKLDALNVRDFDKIYNDPFPVKSINQGNLDIIADSMSKGHWLRESINRNTSKIYNKLKEVKNRAINFDDYMAEAFITQTKNKKVD